MIYFVAPDMFRTIEDTMSDYDLTGLRDIGRHWREIDPKVQCEAVVVFEKPKAFSRCTNVRNSVSNVCGMHWKVLTRLLKKS